MPVPLTDEELLDIPEANLLPGELTRAFQVRAIHFAKLQEEQERGAATRQITLQQTEEAADKEQRDLDERETRMLHLIAEQEEFVRKEAEELDRRTLRLADGRKVYVDGDRYRDAQGRELDGADRAEAEQQQLTQPHAATWQEKQIIDQKQQDLKAMRRNVEDLQAGKGSQDEATAFASYEQELQAKVEANKAGLQKAPDYGDGDLTALSGLARGFSQAASGQSSQTTPGTPATPSALVRNSSAPSYD